MIETGGRVYKAALYPISYNVPCGYFAHARGLKAAAIRAGLRPRRGWSVVADVGACLHDDAVVLAVINRNGYHSRLGAMTGKLSICGSETNLRLIAAAKATGAA